MVKRAIGELKLSPLTDEGKFVFFNDAIKINGKTAKDDKLKLFVIAYRQDGDKYLLNIADVSKAVINVRGEQHVHENLIGYSSLDVLYDHVTGLYKEHFYFGDKQ